MKSSSIDPLVRLVHSLLTESRISGRKMKVFIKTLKGNHFEIDVTPEATVAEVKRKVEASSSNIVYPGFQQMLIYQGRVLEDETTLKENKVVENSFLVIMLAKSSSLAGEGSAGSSKPSRKFWKARHPTPTAAAPYTSVTVAPPVHSPVATPSPALVPASVSETKSEASGDGLGASNLASRSKFEENVQQIIDMGGGTWNRDIVIQALAAAFNDPEQAIEYLCHGIPEEAQIPPFSGPPVTGQVARATDLPFQPTAAPSRTGGPNADPLNIFPRAHLNARSNTSGTENLAFLRNSHQFQALKAMAQANPEILQPMLEELGKQNPNLMRLIQEHQAEFLCLINEPLEGGEGNVMDELVSAMPQAIQVTPGERDSIQRLEAMGFDRALVLEVFFPCNKNEELAANYLLDHIHDLDY